MSAPNTRLDIAVGTRLTTEHSGPATTTLISASLIFGAISAGLAYADPLPFAYTWLWAFFCFFPILAGALYWILLHFVCDSCWSVIVRRIWENMTQQMWALFALFGVVFLFPHPYSFAGYVWKWLDPVTAANDPELPGRSLYLNYEFFVIRAIIYIALLIAPALWYRYYSTSQDSSGHPMYTVLLRRYACPLMVVWALVETFACFDWLMAVDYRWSSSLFGVYTFGVIAQASLAATVVILAVFRSKGYYEVLNAEHFQLIGKLLFGFTIFYGYVAFGQFLLDWYANIPEEMIFYNDHNRGGWVYLTWFVIVGKFVLPVILLVPQETKRNFRFLTGIAILILIMHFVEMFWFIMPYCHSHAYWIAASSFLTYAAVLGFFFVRSCSAVALYPIRDPRLTECLEIKN